MSIAEGIKWNKTITMETIVCCECGVPFGMPSDLKEKCRADSGKLFYCPNGHAQHYSKSTATKVKEEYEAKLKEKQEELWAANSKAVQLEVDLDKANRKLKRVSKGVCPCCNRTFENLARHMKSKHPELEK